MGFGGQLEPVHLLIVHEAWVQVATDVSFAEDMVLGIS